MQVVSFALEHWKTGEWVTLFVSMLKDLPEAHWDKIIGGARAACIHQPRRRLARASSAATAVEAQLMIMLAFSLFRIHLVLYHALASILTTPFYVNRSRFRITGSELAGPDLIPSKFR